MRIVAALGGNALLKRGEPLTAANQLANVRRAAAALAPLFSNGNDLIITHGNGPQVGLLALQSAAGPSESAQPLDILSAESEGMLGYLIEQEIRNLLPPGREVATLLTQVAVDPGDPAFADPTKPVGPLMSEAEARRMADEKGWSVAPETAGWRRVVASPRPRSILELGVITLLVERNVVVICLGGGGIPVARTNHGSLHGVEGVIDKDHASALLAREIAADVLLLLTDVDAIYLGWPEPEACAIAAAAPGHLDPQSFEAGSMRPKVEAAIAFAQATAKPAVIGRLEEAAQLLCGTAGTRVTSTQPALQMRHTA